MAATDEAGNGIGAAGGAAEPIPQDLRFSLEQTMGHDFSGLRVAQGFGQGNAATVARASGAPSYSQGDTIFLRPRAYTGSLHTPESQRHIAHEAAHIVQQRGGRQVL